ncbi:hypothetical protein GO988_19755 [Hymenobacter sp. HMF4947]|uniref:DUF481 domain-containing protein n=1 Tax=Hymenobacter ginkgonis TaxID=2682976 RepID=A0A7K1TJN0_9BACT|nr:hypothetical protein [Hymenobacter ginkgonis]MVN78573.1 hypothetical protein [Hymenobacter ginkgonis]
MKSPYPCARLLAAAAICLPSCTVYAPMQPVMPLVRQRGQFDAGASLQSSGRLEATAAYSPVSHCVVAGAGTVAVRTGQQNYLITRQAEISLGGYWDLSPKWLLSTLGGGGYAYADRQYTFWGTERRTGTYAKLFGQVGLAHLGEWSSFSVTYRLAQVDYRELRTEIGPLPPFQAPRHEVLLASRRALGSTADWHLQSAIGMSFSSLQPASSAGSQAESDRWYAAGIPVPMASLGIVWQPSH